MSTIAEIVNEWFQGEPTPERQQNMRRATLIADLEALLAAASERDYGNGWRDGYSEAVTDAGHDRVDMRKTPDEQERS